MRPRYETSPGIGSGGDTPRAPAALSRDEIQALVHAAVVDGATGMLAEAQRMIRALEKRIDELENRPAGVAPAPAPAHAHAHVAPPPPPMMAQPATVPAVAVQAGAPAAPVVSYAPLPISYAVPIPVSRAPAPLAPTLDVAQIEREVHVEVDSALDGSRRKRRLVIIVVLLMLLVLGGMFALLADSYAPSRPG
jgi:hypothetical protein